MKYRQPVLQDMVDCPECEFTCIGSGEKWYKGKIVGGTVYKKTPMFEIAYKNKFGTTGQKAEYAPYIRIKTPE